MKTLFKITSLIVGILLISCSDDEEMWVKTELPQDTDVSLLEIWSYEVPFQVRSNGEWKIETEGDWFYVFPKSGKGDATVQICVLENETEERQTGTITLSTNNSSAIQTLKIGQKCVSDYGVTGMLDNKNATKKYAVGYGYDTRKEYASPDAVKIQIVRWKEMDAADLIALNAGSASFYERTVTGSSLEELSQSLSASLKFKAKYCGFRSEVKSTFQGSTTDNGFNEYAISYIEYKVTDIILNTDIANIRKHWLTDAARKAINGESDEYKGTDGIHRLFDNYGTHLITKADLGGRLRYNLTVDVSKITGYYDITAYMKASYSNAFISSQASLDAEIQESYKQNKSHTSLSFKASGGNSSSLTDKSDKSAIETWTKSVAEGYDNVNTNKTALIGFGLDLEGLTPLYELADNPTRRNEIKAVMEGDAFIEVEYEDKNTYHIEVPSFDNDLSATLIKEMKDNNDRVIAIVCNEFIPEISPSKRVNVIYPVASGKILMHAGFFHGYQGRRPARISWNGSNLKIIDCDTLQENSYRNLYVSGATIKTESNNDFKRTVCQDAYLKAVNYFNQGDYNYPLVKIFGNIWTREDYKSDKSASGAAYSVFIPKKATDETSVSDGTSSCAYAGNIMYNRKVAKHNDFAPSGWEVPSSNHYKDIEAMLTKYNLHTGQSFRHDPSRPQTLGYEATTAGWMKALRLDGSSGRHFIKYDSNPTENKYWTKDGWSVSINEAGFEVKQINDTTNLNYLPAYHYLPVRLIKKN